MKPDARLSPLLAMPTEIQLQIMRYLLSTSYNCKVERRRIKAPSFENVLSIPVGQNAADTLAWLLDPGESKAIPGKSKIVSSCCLHAQVLQTCSRLYEVGC